MPSSTGSPSLSKALSAVGTSLAHSSDTSPVAEGVSRLALHKDAHEEVLAERWAPGAEVTLDVPEGMELLVLSGAFTEQDEAFTGQSWLRLPPGTQTQAVAGPDGALVWIKRGHLGTSLRVPDLAAA